MKSDHWTTARLAIPLALLALAGTANAREIGGWSVVPQDNTCYMASAFEDGVMLVVIWDPGTKDIGFMAAGNLRGLRGQNGKEVNFDLAFDGRGQPEPWTDDKAVVVDAGDGKVGVIANLGNDQSSGLADAIASASGVRITVDDKVLGAFALNGTRAAYRELMSCGDKLAAGGKS